MPAHVLEKVFDLKANNTNARTEILAGVTTFFTMAYIIVVNPAILAAAGFPTGPTTLATILVAVFGCLLMAFYANKPIAVAPYMGENAFIAFGLATFTFHGNAITPEQRLGTVFVAGVALLILTIARARVWLANSISPSLKHSFGVGIGLFLLFVGCNQTGIVALGVPGAPVKLGNVHDPKVLLAIGGFVVMAVLTYYRIHGAILIGIVATAAAGMILGKAAVPKGLVGLPFTGEYTLGPVFLHLDLRTIFDITFWPIMLTLFLMSFLDTLGTLVGVGAAGDMLDEEGNFPDVQRPMAVDAIACIFASLIGTSTSGAFIESATGIREGGRTGLTALVVAILFALSVFLIPLAAPLQALAFAYGPALIMVGVLMMSSVKHVHFDDLTESVPAVCTIAMMLFTYNIANGLTAGLILYPVMKLLTGRWQELKIGAGVLGLLCLVYYIFGVPH